MTAQTHQQTVDAMVAARNETLIAAATPATNAKIATMQAKAAAMQAEVDAEMSTKLAAVQRIESLLETQRRLNSEIEHLEILKGTAANEAENVRGALRHYIESQAGWSPYGSRNWVAATDEIMRAAIVAPHIPAVLKETKAELASAEKEIKDMAAEHSLDLPRLIAALRQPRTTGEQIVYSLAK